MNIEEMQERKKEMEHCIEQALRRFTDATGLAVESIQMEVHHARNSDGSRMATAYTVEAEVRL